MKRIRLVNGCWCIKCEEWLGCGNVDITLNQMCELTAICPECGEHNDLYQSEG